MFVSGTQVGHVLADPFLNTICTEFCLGYEIMLLSLIPAAGHMCALLSHYTSCTTSSLLPSFYIHTSTLCWLLEIMMSLPHLLPIPSNFPPHLHTIIRGHPTVPFQQSHYTKAHILGYFESWHGPLFISPTHLLGFQILARAPLEKHRLSCSCSRVVRSIQIHWNKWKFCPYF